MKIPPIGRGPAGAPPLVCGVVVTYHPDADVADNLRAVARECSAVVVIDNGSTDEELKPLEACGAATILRLGCNLGVAAALNLGAVWARERGYAWGLAFDQDSRPEPGMAGALWATQQRTGAAVVGPTVREQAANPSGYRWVVPHPWMRGLFHRVGCRDADLVGVTMVVTSGSLFDLEMWSRIGRFDEGLFIDYVDVDYCLRVLRAGRIIAVSAEAVLHHRLGNRTSVRVLGAEVRPMGHAAFRHYYMARNRCATWRRHALAIPHWAAFDCCFAIFNTMRVLAFENAKIEKLRMIIRGMWDGVRGRSGPLPRDSH